jgi:colanic acid/amylovoran biosynthesis glycosyltransferase
MHIAFIVPEFPSLSQTFVLNQITGLLDRGHDVEIFSATAGNDEKYHRDVIKYDLLDRTMYFPKIPTDSVKRRLIGLQHAFRLLPRYPMIVLKGLNLIRFGRLATSFTIMFRVVPFLGKRDFDIIHCHFGPMGNIAVQCHRAGALNGKIVTTLHGYDMTSYPRKYGMNVYEKLFEVGDVFLPISHHWKTKLIDMGCTAEKVMVHRMGVDIQQFHFRKSVRPIKGTIKILSVARLVDKKGIKYSIEAIAKVLKSHDDIEYSIAGDGPLKLELEHMIRRFKLERHVRLLGWRTQTQVNTLMKQSDILLAPSVTSEDGDQEGIPVVLMEALAMGLPVISTYHSGIPELIIDGQTGLLVQERDSSALAAKLNELIGNDALANTLRDNGEKHVKENFDVNKLNLTLEKIYDQLLSK